MKVGPKVLCGDPRVVKSLEALFLRWERCLRPGLSGLFWTVYYQAGDLFR